MKKRICILAFAPIARDARVLRQIEYLSPHYDLTVIGQGEPHPDFPQVDWRMLPPDPPTSILERGLTAAGVAVGGIFPILYDFWYQSHPLFQQMLYIARQIDADAFHANDWETLPLALRAAQSIQPTPVPVVFDAHEFAPLQFEDDPRWRQISTPRITYLLRRYAPRAAASMTVCAPIAGRYTAEFGFAPIVVMNAPKPIDLPIRAVDPNTVRLVYHGVVNRSRAIDRLIEAFALTERRFQLHLYLITDAGYLGQLQLLAEQHAAGRVHFHQPVPVAQLVREIAQYDIGWVFIMPNNYNNYNVLPNKFFDCIHARLALAIGPNPAMAAVIDAYPFGVVAPSFDAADMAATLNALTPDDITRMKRAADAAAHILNADVEMAKVVRIYQDLFAADAAP
ncbi:MAG: glycosyltransferase [Chloroflexota bacterium]|nr:glycosyltransferase [Chloroflexota bacterium]